MVNNAIYSKIADLIENIMREDDEEIIYSLKMILQLGMMVEFDTVINWEEFDNAVEMAEEDAKAIFDNDPAAQSIDEVKLCYPGYYAMYYHRIANMLWSYDSLKVLARYLSEHVHTMTGIDIHPGARIGKRFAIDHGTGIVIGETAWIGDDVTIYQGVTLGAKHLHCRDQKGTKRHPTIQDRVTIYANATVLGDIVVRNDAIIGASAFVTKDVGAHAVVKMGGWDEI